jgi:hypothetical protein
MQGKLLRFNEGEITRGIEFIASETKIFMTLSRMNATSEIIIYFQVF